MRTFEKYEIYFFLIFTLLLCFEYFKDSFQIFLISIIYKKFLNIFSITFVKISQILKFNWIRNINLW